ncbi:SSU rRNA processing protein [Sporodiniella umbellata]|nr:SSU rRNA processing protein [Sporodiniella umbellata]
MSTIENPVTRLEDFQGFKVLPIKTSDSVRHYIYARKHHSQNSSQDKNANRTLFLLNLPVDTTDRHIHKLFKGHTVTEIKYGSDTGSQLRKLLPSGSSAHVVFKHPNDVTEVLSMQRVEKKWAKENEKEQPLGFSRYTLKHKLSRPDAKELQNEVDTFMVKFKEDEYKKERETLERMNQMDDDGFTVVVRHKKNKTTAGDISVSAISAEMAETMRAKPKKELINFYRFQTREKKLNELSELRKKFEEDKVKISKLKQSRKFKPY